jgi:valyl-tRNA synthetase
MLAPWPQVKPELDSPQQERHMTYLMDVIRAIRNMRQELNVPPGKAVRTVFVAGGSGLEIPGSFSDMMQCANLLDNYRGYIMQLGTVDSLEISAGGASKPAHALSAVVSGTEIYIPLAGLVELDKEIARLEKEVAALNRDLQRVQGKLGNQAFLAKAPPDVVDKERAKEDKLESKMATVKQRLSLLSE